EFQASKKTVAATKLVDDDKLMGIYRTDARIETFSKFTLDGEIVEESVVESNQLVVVQTQEGVFLKFPLTEIPEKKKGAVGVRGIKLDKDDYVSDIYLFNDGDEISTDFKGKSVEFSKLKLAHRDTKGVKKR
ncbi:MAG: DNA gyrase C-terminal beta-propeller domain-containing protein, partial [Lachnospiraceae bacterium]